MEISAPNTFGTRKGVMLTHSLLVALATFLLALLSLSLSSEARHFTPLWFPTAAAIAVLYRHAPRHWGLPLLASGLGIVLASFLLFGISIIPVKLAAINLLEAAVCALLLRRAAGERSAERSGLLAALCGVRGDLHPAVQRAAGRRALAHAGSNVLAIVRHLVHLRSNRVLSLAPLGLTYHRRTLAALNPLLLTLMGSWPSATWRPICRSRSPSSSCRCCGPPSRCRASKPSPSVSAPCC